MPEKSTHWTFDGGHTGMSRGGRTRGRTGVVAADAVQHPLWFQQAGQRWRSQAAVFTLLPGV